MAYMSQENKKEKEIKIKEIFKKYGLKGSVSVRHMSTLVVKIKSGKIDFFNSYNGKVENGYIDVNPYWYHQHFTGNSYNVLKEIIMVMNEGNHNRSDPQSDYFDVGWYIDIHIGEWNKPYQYN